MEPAGFKTWAIVELMGHTELAGYVQQENIAGCHMLRIDVPKTKTLDGFTKYVSPSALYGITPCTEETAIMRAEDMRATPFSSWSIERQIVEKLRADGRLLESPKPQAPSNDQGFTFDDDETQPE